MSLVSSGLIFGSSMVLGSNVQDAAVRTGVYMGADYSADIIRGVLPQLPNTLSFLGSYGSDVFESLVFAALMYLLRKYTSVITSGTFLKDMLQALGVSVATGMVAGSLPAVPGQRTRNVMGGFRPGSC